MTAAYNPPYKVTYCCHKLFFSNPESQTTCTTQLILMLINTLVKTSQTLNRFRLFSSNFPIFSAFIEQFSLIRQVQLNKVPLLITDVNAWHVFYFSMWQTCVSLMFPFRTPIGFPLHNLPGVSCHMVKQDIIMQYFLFSSLSTNRFNRALQLPLCRGKSKS